MADLRSTLKVQAERAVLAAVRLPDSQHDPANPFGELRALAEQAGAVVVGELEQFRDAPESGTYIGSGKLEELAALAEAVNATTIIFDHELSPKQIAAIEEVAKRKVIDRSELILDIFAGRATTHEAKLQVEIAQLEYTYPRLRAMWTHLERIVGSGGIGGIGTRGPGEQQLEIDRRLVQNRLDRLRRQLKEIQIRRRREVRERKRGQFSAAIVGYTNAGKSTLFNTLTAGGAYADDRLFATLMTRTRRWDLGGGAHAMLSDTVGFVRDLPHHLVASFRATLEEATHADLLLIVIDAADPGAAMHYKTVLDVLEYIQDDTRKREEREGEEWEEPVRMLLLNKTDRLASNEVLLEWQQRVPDSIAITATPGTDEERPGQVELRRRIREMVVGELIEADLRIPMSQARAIHEIESRGTVVTREYDADALRMVVRIGRNDLARINPSGSFFVRPPPRPHAWKA